MDRFGQDDRILGMNAEEDQFLRKVLNEILVSPIMTAPILIQLGYEPFPLSMGTTLSGRNAYYHPNLFSYAWQLAKSHPLGWSVLTTGCESRALEIIANRYTIRWGTKYLNAVFGKSEHEGVDEFNLTKAQSFCRLVRGAIRDSIVRIVAVFAARPFTVVCIRQIAQLVGGETKYLGIWQSMRLIFTEEGFGGLFSGVIPQLCAEMVMVWGSAAFIFAYMDMLKKARTYFDLVNNENAMKTFDVAQKLIVAFAPSFGASLSYPLSVVSNVMACVGSGLAVSFLPFNPTFNNWMDCYQHRWPRRPSFGGKAFYREHTGAVFVRLDHQLYSLNKH